MSGSELLAKSSRFDSRATHARTLLPAALASVPFGFVFARVRAKSGALKISKMHVRRHARSKFVNWVRSMRLRGELAVIESKYVRIFHPIILVICVPWLSSSAFELLPAPGDGAQHKLRGVAAMP